MKKNKKTLPGAQVASFHLVTENGLTESALKQATQMLKAAPKIAIAYAAFKEVEGETKSRFWQLTDELRTPVDMGNGNPPAVMNGPEITIILQALGEHKVRVSEWKKVCEMPEEMYKRCRALSLPKLQTLQIARGTARIVGEGDEAEVEPVKKAPPKATPTGPTYHKVSPEFLQAFHDLISSQDGLRAQADSVPYEFKGETADGRSYQVTIYVDASPTAPKVT